MNEELREGVKETIRRYDHDADDLRELATAFESLADQYDAQDSVL